MIDLTLISSSRNTPIVTQRMLKSFLMFHPKCKILICDNSTDNLTRKMLETAKIPVIEPTPVYHSPSVDCLLKSVKTKYCILVDTDVIFLKSNNHLFQKFIRSQAAVMGKISGDPEKFHPRIDPCYMLVDIEKINKVSISYHDINRTETAGPDSSGKYFDVGSSFLKDIKDKGLKILNYDGEETYYKHYGGMSWNVVRYVTDRALEDSSKGNHRSRHWLSRGKEIFNIYMKETSELANIKLRYRQ